MSHLPVLVILLPLCGTLLCPLISHFSADWGKRTVICTLFLAVICSLVQLWQVISSKEALHYELGGWQTPFGIEFVIDAVNGVIVVLVAVISWTTALFSSLFEKSERAGNNLKSAGYYSMLAFLALGLLGMASTGDAFNLYVFMEITAISGYGLIACRRRKRPYSSIQIPSPRDCRELPCT